MDESKLLEECINIKLTPLQTLLLSETVIVIHTLIDFLLENDCMEIKRVKDDTVLPGYEQTGNILIKSALASIQEVRVKIWKGGKEEIGENIPKEFEGVVGAYSVLVEQIANQFVQLLGGRER